MTILSSIVFVTAIAGTGPALASAKLAQDKQCMQCHAIDKDTIGPSFRKIKVIYGRMKNPEARLIEVMRQGSSVHLGPLSTPARMPDGSERPPINDREARQLARWILS